jgi:hypothetical protein
VLGGQGALDLLVVHDPAGGGVDEEHPARLQPALGDDLGVGDVQDADLAGQHDQVVLGVPPAARAQPLRSRTAPMSVPSVNATAAGPSHGSMIEEWNR